MPARETCTGPSDNWSYSYALEWFYPKKMVSTEMFVSRRTILVYFCVNPADFSMEYCQRICSFPLKTLSMDHNFIISVCLTKKEGVFSSMVFLFYLDFKWFLLYGYTEDSQGLTSGQLGTVWPHLLKTQWLHLNYLLRMISGPSWLLTMHKNYFGDC